MSKHQSLTSKLVGQSASVVPIKSNDDLPERDKFQRQIIRVEEKLANPLAQQQAGYYANEDWGAEIFALESSVEELEEQYQDSRSYLHELRLAVMTTPESVRRNTPSCRGGQATTVFSRWRLTDQLNFVVLLVAFFLSLMVGVANPYVVLMNSGLSVFIDHWYLAFLISLVVPLGSLLIKFYGNNFTYHRHKKQFIHVVYGSSPVSC